MRQFEYRQKWPQCKGYSLCKIITLGQKIELPKTHQKRTKMYIKMYSHNIVAFVTRKKEDGALLGSVLIIYNLNNVALRLKAVDKIIS